MKQHPARKKLLGLLGKDPNATFEEMMRATGLASKAAVDYHLTKLMVAGLVRKNDKYNVIAQ